MTPLRAKIPALPPRLEGLAALAVNLAWSWHRQARALFRRVDETLWRDSHHNPIIVLSTVAAARLEALAKDADFCSHYDEVMAWLEREQSGGEGWFREQYPDIAIDRPVAYFCAEFGLHASVPIYSGGLARDSPAMLQDGVRPGRPVCPASEGSFYKKGYFDQRITPQGWQEDSDEEVNPANTPLIPVAGADGTPWVTVLNTFGRAVHIGVWTMTVGRAPLYLLDTDLELNHADDRSLTSKLYSGGAEMRLRQEWILGTGGVRRVLRALGITPGAWHANEGHAAFMMLERLRELVGSGTPWTLPRTKSAARRSSPRTRRYRRGTTRSMSARSPPAPGCRTSRTLAPMPSTP